VPPHTVVAGVPAQVVRTITGDDPPPNLPIYQPATSPVSQSCQYQKP
jgi:hypothetical protein